MVSVERPSEIGAPQWNGSQQRQLQFSLAPAEVNEYHEKGFLILVTMTTEMVSITLHTMNTFAGIERARIVCQKWNGRSTTFFNVNLT